MRLHRRPELRHSSGVFRGVYDNFPGLVHVYEPARRTLTAYTGNLVRLRRASDDAEADFGYLANGNLDTAAIAAWAAGASYIVTIYDQVAGDNVTQGTAANQPLFAADMLNTRAGGFYDGTDDYLRGAYTIGGALSQPFSVYALAQLDATVVDDDGAHYIVDGDGVPRMVMGQALEGDPNPWRIYAGTVRDGGASNADWNIWAALFNGNSSEFWINSASETAGAVGAENAAGITIGSRPSADADFWKGYIGPIIIVDPAHSDAQRVAMQNSINSFYGAY